MLATTYTLSEKTTLPFDQAVERVREELKTEGFGVLCEIDVQATLKEKLGVDGEPYTILGACNPPLAHQALQAEPRSTPKGCSRSSATSNSPRSPPT